MKVRARVGVKRLFYLVLILFLGSYQAFLNQAYAQEGGGEENPEKELEVVVGIDKNIQLDFVPSPKIQVGNATIIDYQLIPVRREITFKGVKPGKSSVTIRDNVGDIKARYLITVTANDLSRVVKELKELIGDVEGIEIGIKGDQVYVGGSIVVPDDIGKVVVVLGKYDNVLRLVELSALSQKTIAEKMQEEIQRQGMRDVTVRVMNSVFLLEGVVTSQDAKSRAELLAALLVPDRIESLAKRTESIISPNRPVIQNLIQVNEKKQQAPIPKMVKVIAQLVELTKDYNRVFGFKWTPLLSGTGGAISFGKTESGGVTTRSDGTLSGTISNLFPRLASAKGAGYARVVQSGVIITEAEKDASIAKTESKPFAIGTGEFLKAGEARAGFELTVKPSLLPQEKVHMTIRLKVSATIGNPPETLSNDINTQVIVGTKESAVIGGVVIDKSATDFDRDPPFGQDVVDTQANSPKPLFSFLRSKSYLSKKSQFVVFLTPEIIESASRSTEEIKRKFRRRRR